MNPPSEKTETKNPSSENPIDKIFGVMLKAMSVSLDMQEARDRYRVRADAAKICLLASLLITSSLSLLLLAWIALTPLLGPFSLLRLKLNDAPHSVPASNERPYETHPAANARNVA